MKYLVFYDSGDGFELFGYLGGVFDSPEDAQKLVDKLSKKYRKVFQIEVMENTEISEELFVYIE